MTASHSLWSPKRLKSCSPAKPVDPKIETARRELEQLKMSRERIDARLRYLVSEQARRKDTRRSILVGAIMLA